MIKLLYLTLFLVFITIIDSRSVQFIEEEDSEGIPAVRTKLPILLRTLRLRDFSQPKYGYFPDVYKKQLRLRPYLRNTNYKQDEEDDSDEIKVENMINKRSIPENGEEYESSLGYDQDNIPGYKLIGRHRRPHGPYRQKVFPLPVHQRIRTLRKGKSTSGCSDENNKAFLSCFKTYFDNFDLSFTDKLPLIEKVYEEMNKNVDYQENQKWHNQFKQCYEPLPSECFKSSNFANIIENTEESDIYSAFFTSAEYIYIDKHFQDMISCFIDNMDAMPLITEKDTPEEKNKKCEDAENKVKNAQDKFMKSCKNLEATDDEYKQWFTPFIKRQSIGEYCPRINILTNTL